MRVTNITNPGETLTIDEYLDTSLSQFRLKLREGESKFVDDQIAGRSKQLAQFQQQGKVAMIPTASEITLAAGVTGITITVDTDIPEYTAETPVRAVVIKSPDIIYVKVENQTATTFDLNFYDAAGAAYTTLAAPNDLTIYYSFGTELQRLA